MRNAFSGAAFLVSAGRLQELPPAGPPEIAFAGRSNVGKSSAINTLAGRKRLAFFSKTPGRTQTINFYGIGERARLVDLPGYGYARVPQELRAHWEELAGGYLRKRQSLCGVVAVMDARRPFTPADEKLLAFVGATPVLVLLTKADKLGRTAQARILDEVRHRARTASVQLFSSHTHEGVEETREFLDAWLPAEGPAAGIKNPR